jgi:hypothetical protein
MTALILAWLGGALSFEPPIVAVLAYKKAHSVILTSVVVVRCRQVPVEQLEEDLSCGPHDPLVHRLEADPNAVARSIIVVGYQQTSFVGMSAHGILPLATRVSDEFFNFPGPKKLHIQRPPQPFYLYLS